ncbi:MAG TPA: VOC family protein [Pyrinomonadaceae bacterium]|jgi:catechol 2,3-dioxygenase-like lactoylglutathione lyase family enzyme|nr:VOC family protein [Pyrinomonadaceae bacterium]
MKISVKRLGHLQLSIPPGGEDRARQFYGGILGLEEIEKPDALKPGGGMWYLIADIQLHIGIEDGQGRSKRHPAFEVEDLDAVKKYLHEQGVEIREEVRIPGVERFSLFDPFGNRIELFEGREEETAGAP